MGKRISLSIVLLTAIVISLAFHSSVLAQELSKYDYIEYHTTAEGKEDFGTYDPINPKSVFYTDEEKVAIVFAFNRLDGTVDLEFDFYKDGSYVTGWTEQTKGDGRRHSYDFKAHFANFPVSDLAGDWEVDTYIDGNYAFTDEFSIVSFGKYDYIDYHTMAEGTLDYYPYDPINPKSVFYTDEGRIVLAFAFNRLDGRVDMEFDLYQDGLYVTTYEGWAEGDGREWFYAFTADFVDLPVKDVAGDWYIEAYIDGEYMFTDKFSIVDYYYNGGYDENESFFTMLIVTIMFYLVYIVPYIVVQAILKKRLRVKSMMVGGTLVFVFFIFILILASDGDGPTGTETVYLIIGAVIMLLILRFFEAMYPGKKKETPEKAPAPPPPQPAPVEKKEKPKPAPPAPEPKPEKKIEKEPAKKSGPMKNCPYCKGKLSELNFYKLKSGNDVTCEYCGEIISS
jgi:hypothetical protein